MANIISTKVITGKVRLSYCRVFAPEVLEDGRTKYSTVILVPKSDTKTIDAIANAIDAAKRQGASEKWGGKVPARLHEPLRDGDEERPTDAAYKGCYFLNCVCYTKPGIIDKERRPIINSEELYSGCYALASISFYPFDKAGNKGISCGLNNLMKVADGEMLGGRAEAVDDFASVDFNDDDDDDLL